MYLFILIKFPIFNVFELENYKVRKRFIKMTRRRFIAFANTSKNMYMYCLARLIDFY